MGYYSESRLYETRKPEVPGVLRIARGYILTEALIIMMGLDLHQHPHGHGNVSYYRVRAPRPLLQATFESFVVDAEGFTPSAD